MWQLHHSLTKHSETLRNLHIEQNDELAIAYHNRKAARLSELLNKYLTTFKKEFEAELVKILLHTLLLHYVSCVEEEKRKTWWGRWFPSDFEIKLKSLLNASKGPRADIKNILQVLLNYNAPHSISKDKELSSLKSTIQKFFPLKQSSEFNFIEAVNKIECNNPILSEKRNRLCSLAETQAVILENLFEEEQSLYIAEQKWLNDIPQFSSDTSFEERKQALITYAEARCPSLLNENDLVSRFTINNTHDNFSRDNENNMPSFNRENKGYALINPDDIEHMSEDELDNLETGSVGSSVLETSTKDQEKRDRKNTVVQAIIDAYLPKDGFQPKNNDRSLMEEVRKTTGGWNRFSYIPSEYETVNKLLAAAGKQVDEAAMIAALRRIKRLEEKHPDDQVKQTAFRRIRQAFGNGNNVTTTISSFSKTQGQVNAITTELSERKEIHEFYLVLDSEIKKTTTHSPISREALERKSETELQNLAYNIAYVNAKPLERITLEKDLADPIYAKLLEFIADQGLYDKSKTLCFLVLVIGIQLLHAKDKNDSAYNMLRDFLNKMLVCDYENAVYSFNSSLSLPESELDWLQKYFPDSIENLFSRISIAKRLGGRILVPLTGDEGLFPPNNTLLKNVSRSVSGTSLPANSQVLKLASHASNEEIIALTKSQSDSNLLKNKETANSFGWNIFPTRKGRQNSLTNPPSKTESTTALLQRGHFSSSSTNSGSDGKAKMLIIK